MDVSKPAVTLCIRWILKEASENGSLSVFHLPQALIVVQNGMWCPAQREDASLIFLSRDNRVQAGKADADPLLANVYNEKLQVEQ